MADKKKMTKKEKEQASLKRKRGRKERDRERIFRRSIFYAISLFVVYQLMLIPLQTKQYGVYWIASGIGLVVVLAELLYSRLSESGRPMKVDRAHLKSVRWREHLLHHAVLPILLYTSGVLFLFFNRITALDQAAIVILSGLFFMVLYNVSATYLRMYRLSRNTRVVFDFVNIFVFYFGVDAMINLSLYEGISRTYVLVGSALLTFVLIGLMIVSTKQWSLEMLGVLIAGSVLVGLTVYIVWLLPVFNIAVISLVSTVMFYLVDVYWHHSLEGSFSWDVMSQYMLYALMALILLLYI